MPGKRIDQRAHELSEDRMKRPAEDRGARKKGRNRYRAEESSGGFSAQDERRIRAYDAETDPRKQAFADFDKKKRR